LLAEGIGLPSGLSRLLVADRCLRHERTQAGIVGFLLEEDELLLGDSQLGSLVLEPVGDVDEAAFEVRGHVSPRV